jgi:hypothetical protein
VAAHLTGDLIGIGMGCGRRCTTELNGAIVWCIGSVIKDDITDTDAAHRAAVIARSNAMVGMEMESLSTSTVSLFEVVSICQLQFPAKIFVIFALPFPPKVTEASR